MADLYIVNSCTVTAAADRQSRQMLYRARRRNPKAKVILTGCLARLMLKEQSNPIADAVFSLAEHQQLAQYVHELHAQLNKAKPVAPASKIENPSPRRRPFLKIQDGCNSACSYCIVPKARGPSISVPAHLVHQRLLNWASQGYAEVVLTGIHLGWYGKDLIPPCNLVKLLHELKHIVPRLRLSSIEPLEVEPALVQMLAQSNAVCPHLHIPLQSGTDEILLAMNRPYTSQWVMDLFQHIRHKVPHAALGTDLIVGFPGETEDHFHRTLRFLEHSPITHLHVFTYSSRPGTLAAKLPNPIPPAIIRERSQTLRQIGLQKKLAFAHSQIGTTRMVVVEIRRAGDGLLTGLTDNYLRVVFPGEDHLLGQMIPVSLEELRQEMIYGKSIAQG
jgi:threonylcarbamoyladenosine tRNA methylthiotransferase MtaB